MTPPGASDDGSFRQLLWNSFVAVALAATLVTLCYFFVDRPVAYFVHAQQFNRDTLLKWLTLPPPVMQQCVPALLVVLAVRRAFGPFTQCELLLGLAGVSMVLADQFRGSLSYLCGRYWPETWINNNPSLIGTGAFGFHPFHNGSAYGSFPSGHMTRTVAFVAVFWIAAPRWRWVCIVASLAVAVGLLGMNYHFVGDVIGGAFLGGIVGAYVSRCSGIGKPVHNLTA